MGMEIWIWRDGYGDAGGDGDGGEEQKRVKLFLVPFTILCLLSLVVDDISPSKTESSAEKKAACRTEKAPPARASS